MKKIILLISFFMFFLSVNANNDLIYTNNKDFLKYEWNICSLATDWCNSIMINNWVLWWMTKMYCEDVYWENWTEKWSCLEYREDINISKPEIENYILIKKSTSDEYIKKAENAKNLFKEKTKNEDKENLKILNEKLQEWLVLKILDFVYLYPEENFPEDVYNTISLYRILKYELEILK